MKNNFASTCFKLFFAVIAAAIISQPAVTNKLISPLSNTQGSFTMSPSAKGIREEFTFAPGWALNNLNMVDFSNLSMLAYYDIPALEDGTLYRDNNGYSLFREVAEDLRAHAHSQDTKVLITVSQADNAAIKAIVSNKEVQNKLIDEIITEVQETGIDGVAIDFELHGESGTFYQSRFTSFIENLTEKLHREVSGSTVAVSVSSSGEGGSLYDISSLGSTADKVLLMAYDFAAPEVKNASVVTPEYTASGSEYWRKVSNYLDGYVNKVSTSKLVLERAWYGNGENYPLYTPQEGKQPDTTNYNSLKTPLSGAMIERMVEGVPLEARSAARKNLPLIAKALEKEGILNQNVLAYALATIEHETAGTFEPIEEILGRKSARRLGYEGGTNYFGRGFIQLTHLRNYKVMGERIGLGSKLAENPDLALHPEISAKILAAYFKDNGIADLATNGDFVAARAPVNPDYNGWSIANLAFKFLYAQG